MWCQWFVPPSAEWSQGLSRLSPGISLDRWTGSGRPNWRLDPWQGHPDFNPVVSSFHDVDDVESGHLTMEKGHRNSGFTHETSCETSY